MNFIHHILGFNAESPLLFTQFYFWAFFALVYALFALLISLPSKEGYGLGLPNRRLHLRNVYLMFVSWFFYYKTSGLFLLILAFVTLSDWLIAKRIHKNLSAQAVCQQSGLSANRSVSKAVLWLMLSVVIDLSILFYFKYAYFFTNVINSWFGADFRVFDIFAYIGNGFSEAGRFDVDTIILPVGISFYTFQVISYTCDVFRRKIEPVKNILDFGFYVSFFPQLYKPFRLSRRAFGIAVFWILNGLAKKIIMSDYLAVNLIDRVFDNPLLFSGFENLFALFAYSLQVYADFSGYTDIAIGVAMLMGFYLPMNFNSPYKSKTPQEFWRRWHMSLGRWLKSYLYIPLGGNRTILGFKAPKLWAANFNSFITQVLGGLWHGASWNFVLWGAINGVGMIIKKIWREWNWHVRFAAISALTFGLVMLDYFYHLPVWRLFAVWATIIWFGTAIRYIYWLITADKIINHKFEILNTKIANAWAILQTFAFITFTRLFFRSSSNLDPATANEVAWETAKNMVNQIGGAWNNAIIPDFLWEYRWVVAMFVAGMLIHWIPTNFKRRYRLWFSSMPLWLMVIVVCLAIVVIYQFVSAEMQPFIYFQF